MLKTISLTIAGLVLVAVVFLWPSDQPPALSPSGSSVWSILNGTPVHVDDKGKTFFVFPTVSPGVNYLTRPVSGLPVGLSLVSIAYTITATGAPIFNYRTNRNNTCGPGFPGTVRLFIQRAGDDIPGAGRFQQYRYWSTRAVQELAPGSFTLRAMIDPAQWTDIYAKSGSDYPERFREALQNAARIGITFGGGCFYGHGVFNADGNSTARFTLDAFSVE